MMMMKMKSKRVLGEFIILKVRFKNHFFCLISVVLAFHSGYGSGLSIVVCERCTRIGSMRYREGSVDWISSQTLRQAILARARN